MGFDEESVIAEARIRARAVSLRAMLFEVNLAAYGVSEAAKNLVGVVG